MRVPRRGWRKFAGARVAVWISLAVAAAVACGNPGGADAPGYSGCGNICRGLVGKRNRPRGVDPPPVGTDAIPGIDFAHPRPPPAPLRDVVPGELVRVPAGPFWMGSDEVPDEAPRHRVVLPEFFIERTEVSVGQFRRFVAAGAYDDPTFWSRDGWAWRLETGARPLLPEQRDAMPMTNVSFYEAEAYAAWAGRRLPTEAEWEKAARGTDGRRFPWGNESDPTRSHHWLYKLAPPIFSDLAWPVASGRSGASPYGVLHMAGNVWEWTAGNYSGTGYRPADNLTRSVPSGPWRTIRGGAWTTLLSYQRTTAREPAHPGERRPTLGFRCAADTAPPDRNSQAHGVSPRAGGRP